MGVPLRCQTLVIMCCGALLVGCTVLQPNVERVQLSSSSSPTDAVVDAPAATATASPAAASPSATGSAAAVCQPASAGGPAAPSDAPWGKAVELTEAKWNDPESYPVVQPGSFWAPDNPKRFEPQAFGVLPPELDVYTQKPLIERYELNAMLEEGPTELPVYVVGRYPEAHSDVLKQTIEDLNGWNFIPPLSTLAYGGLPLGEPAPITTTEQAAQRAEEVVRPFLMSDSIMPTVKHRSDGEWDVVYYQHVNGFVVYVDRPLRVLLNAKGQVASVQGRRRPLIAQSVYPLRSVEEAWQLLTQGCGFAVDFGSNMPQPPDEAEFNVHAVELAYLVTHANSPREIMQPYYVFRNEAGRGLFVPAVADPYIEWSER
jgi:hypothetical protein